MKEPIWLTMTMLEAIHVDLIREHGGAFGIRDQGLVESALARPRQKWTYDADVDLAALAAAYGFGLAKNHGFVDGNKRLSLMAIYVFLKLNGRELNASEPEVVAVVSGVAAGSITEAELATWIRNHIDRARG